MSYFTQAANAGSDYVRFDDTNINQPVEMEITNKYSVRQGQFKGVPKVNLKTGAPEYESVVPVRVNGQDMIFSDSGRFALVQAIGKAVVGQGVEDLEIGGKLSVTYTGKVTTKKGNTANSYEASYERAKGDNVKLATPDFDPRTQPQNVPQAAPQQQPQQQQNFQQGNQFQQQGGGFQQPQQQQNFQPQQQQGGNFQQFDGPSQNANSNNPWG